MIFHIKKIFLFLPQILPACGVSLIFADVNFKLNIMKEIVEKISAAYEAFQKDASAQIESGNKAAGTRARKASLEIEKLMKEFRKASLDESKK